MPAWAVWAVIAALLGGVEMMTPGLFFAGLVALAAIAAAVVAAAGAGLVLQFLVFIVGSLAALVLLRPIVRRQLHTPAQLRTGTAALVGTRGVALSRVDASGGRVRIGGEEWSARAFLDDQVIEEGARVEVVQIEGATALVLE